MTEESAPTPSPSPPAGPAPAWSGALPPQGTPSPDGSAAAGETTWIPSGRLTALLAAAMLAIGVGVGAAIGPAPDASFAGASRIPLLSSLIARASAAGASASAQVSTQTSTGSPVAGAPHRRRRHRAKPVPAPSETEPVTSSEGAGSAPAKVTAPHRAPSVKPLPPVAKVWLVELSGSSFAEALAAPSVAAYIDAQAIPAGALLSGWSSLAAGALASDAALIATSEARLVNTISEPSCPEGAAGAACAAGTPGALKSADEFLKQTLATLTASRAYRTSGLIVITFAAISSGASSELPAGSTTATLASQPPAGALLISPFVTPGRRPTTKFNASAPRRSLEALLHR